MKKLGLALAILLLGLAPAQSQQVQPGASNNPAGAYNSSPPTCVSGSFCLLQVDVNGNLKISGTVTVDTSLLATAAKQDTGNTSLSSIDTKLSSQATATNQTSVQSPVAPATATATKSILLGAQATTAAVNPTTGQQSALSSDTNNNLLVSSGGAPNLTIVQVSIATSDTLAIAARALRRSVTIQQITGTQNVFCNQTTATAGNGVVLPAVVGASFTFNTTSAIRCIAITGAQTVAVAETY